MISRSVNLLKTRDDFKSKGFTVIPDFLDPKIALDFYNSLIECPEENWFHVLGDAKSLSNSSYFLTSDTTEIRSTNHLLSLESFSKGEYSYSFKELSPSNTSLGLKKFIKYFNSREIKDVFSFICQSEILNTKSLTCNRFDNQDFILGTKNLNLPRFEIYYNLTPHWNINLGGALSFPHPTEPFELSFNNDFNSLLLLDNDMFRDVVKKVNLISHNGNISKYIIQAHYENKDEFLNRLDI